MKITIGSDHRGFELKKKIIEYFSDISWLDVGVDSDQRVDYPIFSKKVCQNILTGKSDFGILICGSGIGMSVAANRCPKIYAGLCWNYLVAKTAKEDDNINVLVLPSDFITNSDAFEIIQTWLSAKFKEANYLKRLVMIDE